MIAQPKSPGKPPSFTMVTCLYKPPSSRSSSIDLYKNGLQRSNFIPFIHVLKVCTKGSFFSSAAGLFMWSARFSPLPSLPFPLPPSLSPPPPPSFSPLPSPPFPLSPPPTHTGPLYCATTGLRCGLQTDCPGHSWAGLHCVRIPYVLPSVPPFPPPPSYLPVTCSTVSHSQAFSASYPGCFFYKQPGFEAKAFFTSGLHNKARPEGGEGLVMSLVCVHMEMPTMLHNL